MSFNINKLTDYTEKSTELLRNGVLYSEDFKEFNYQTGIMYEEYLNYIDVDPTLVAGSCGASDGGTTSFDERLIKVIPMKSDNRFCFDDLYKKAITHLDVAGAITKDFVDKLKAKVEHDLWIGNTLGVTGWIQQANGDGDVVAVNGPNDLDVSNIDDEIIKMINAIPNALQSRGLLTLYVSYSVFNMYKQNRLAANYFRDANADFGVNEMWVFGYEGQIKIKAIAGFNTNDYMLLTFSKNLTIGTDDVNQIASAKWVIDEVEEYAWLKSKFKLGTQYIFPGEIVLWKLI
jgi:hypothetical protein